MKIRVLATAVAGASLLALPVASGARAPSLAERAAVVRALPAFVRNAPLECAWLKIRVSENPRYALVDPVFMNTDAPRCARYAADGFFVLRKSAKWTVIYNGSDLPRCARRIPRDLVRCLP